MKPLQNAAVTRSSSGRIPSFVLFGAMAFGLTVLTGGVWTGLLVGNLLTTPAIPWSVVAMGVLLWIMWQYFGGRWAPNSTSTARRRYRRANYVPARVLAWALTAGLLSLGASIALWIVMFQLVKLPGNLLPDFSKYPLVTVLLVLGMASVATSTAEEIGFRGYFITKLEGRLSGPVAVVIAALVISPAHGITQGFLWPTLLWYVFADVMFGTLSYVTKSILPGLVVHIIGLMIFFTLIWPADKYRHLIWVSGPDPGFWTELAAAVILVVLAVLAFRRLVQHASRDLVQRPESLVLAT